MTDAPLSPVAHRALARAGLLPVWEKLRAGQRLDADDGLRLFTAPDLAAVGFLANELRERHHGDRVWFNRNTHINATNVCEASCVFCSFARLKTGDPQAWTLSIDDALRRLKVLDGSVLTEVHIVNGLNPDLPWDYYPSLLRALKAHRPELHIKGFTAVEVHYYAQKYSIPMPDVLRRLREAGLDSLPGGGAEIFAHRARAKLCDDKVDADGWLAVHREAHRQGMFSNCTMLFGSIETLDERVDHLLRLRALQDESLRAGATDPTHGGGHFQTFIPLRFHNEGNRLSRLASPTGYDSLRTLAVARLLLDNIPHVKAYWPMLGTDEAEVAQWFGSSDLDGTVREEHIYHMAGAATPQGLTRAELVRSIRRAGRLPVERDTLYNALLRDDPAEAAPLPGRPRLGWVHYQNALPLVKHLDGVDLRGGHPVEVARWLGAGEVELALLPVGALLSDSPALGDGGGGSAGDRAADRRGWRVVPELCIGCDGEVGSVVLVADTPPEQWTEVRLDGVSRTSALLARLLLTAGPLAARVPPGLRLRDVPPGEGLAGAGRGVAALVIGDAARAPDAQRAHRIDLGAAWKAWTGLPFVFAVWAGRADLDPAVVDHVRRAGAKGLAGLRDGSLLEGLPPADQVYLRDQLRYALDDRALMGLQRFAALAMQHGLVARSTFTLYPPPARVRRPQAAAVDAALDRGARGLPLGADELARLWEHAPLPALMLAAAERAGAGGAGGAASYGLRGAGGLPQARVGGGADLPLPDGPFEARVEADPERSGPALAAELLRLRAAPGLFAAAAAPPAAGGAPTAWLRLTALLRLALPDAVRVAAPWTDHGRGLAQVALHGGAADLGEVLPPEADAEMEDGVWPMTLREAERLIRLAGRDPAPRGPGYEPLGPARTAPEARDRPLRRLDRPGAP